MSTTHPKNLEALSALKSSPAGEHVDRAERDFMPLNGIDHIELWVGNAAQASYFFQRAFNFTEVAYRGLETGERDRVSRVLQQGEIRLVVTGGNTTRFRSLQAAAAGDLLCPGISAQAEPVQYWTW